MAQTLTPHPSAQNAAIMSRQDAIPTQLALTVVHNSCEVDGLIGTAFARF